MSSFGFAYVLQLGTEYLQTGSCLDGQYMLSNLNPNVDMYNKYSTKAPNA